MSMVNEFVCPPCGFRFGPVGVQPYVPSAERHQLFLVCTDCRNPAVLMGIPGAVDFDCRHCQGTRFTALSECPKCGSAEAGWRPCL